MRAPEINQLWLHHYGSSAQLSRFRDVTWENPNLTQVHEATMAIVLSLRCMNEHRADLCGTHELLEPK